MNSNHSHTNTHSRLVFACFLAACVIFAGACSSEDTGEETARSPETSGVVEKKTPKSPAEVVRSYLNAMLAEDHEVMANLMTQKAREAAQSFEHRITVQSDNADFEVGGAEIDGDRASVSVTLNVPDVKPPEQEMTYRLRRDNGRWGIYAVGTWLEDGGEFTMNYEQMGEMGRNMDEAYQQMTAAGGHPDQAAAQRNRFEALRSVDPAAFKDRWQINLSVEARPAGELLAKLLGPMGLIPPPDAPGDLLASPVTLNITNGSRLEWIERVCQAIGHYPEYPMTKEMKDELLGGFGRAVVEQAGQMIESPKDAPPANALTLKKGPRKRPVAFSGPLMIEVADMTQKVAYATGSISLRVYGTDMGADGFDMIKAAEDPLTIDKITGPNGNNLFDRMGTGFAVEPYGSGAFFRIDRNIILKKLLRHVTHLDPLSGKVAFSLPAAVEKGSVRLDNQGTEKTASLGDLAITARQRHNSVRFQFKGPTDLLEDMIVRFDPEDADGHPIFITSTGYSFMVNRSDYQLSLSRPAETVAYKVAIRQTPMQYPFSFQAVALPEPETMPASLRSLKFSGHDKPVAIELVKMDRSAPAFDKAHLHVVNHTNKAIARIDARFVYLDDQGAVLKEFPHTLEGVYTDTGREPFIGADMAADQAVTAFFMPEKTTDIRFEIEQITFMDTTQWRP